MSRSLECLPPAGPTACMHPFSPCLPACLAPQHACRPRPQLGGGGAPHRPRGLWPHRRDHHNSQGRRLWWVAPLPSGRASAAASLGGLPSCRRSGGRRLLRMRAPCPSPSCAGAEITSFTVLGKPQEEDNGYPTLMQTGLGHWVARGKVRAHARRPGQRRAAGGQALSSRVHACPAAAARPLAATDSVAPAPCWPLFCCRSASSSSARCSGLVMRSTSSM